jgi:hypothetical protein
MSATVKLDYPVTVDGQQVTEITLRRPKARDYLTASRVAATAAEQEIRMICNLAEVSDKVVEELDWADYLKVQAALQNFSKPGERQGR